MKKIFLFLFLVILIPNIFAFYYVGHSSPVTFLSESKDKKYLFSGDMDGIVNIWNLNTQEFEKTINTGLKYITGIIFDDSQNTFLVSSKFSKNINKYDFITGSLIKSYELHLSGINSIDISENGIYLLSGSSDNSIRIFDLKNETIANTIYDGYAINSVKFLKNGNSFICSTMHNKVRMYSNNGLLLNQTFVFGTSVKNVFATDDENNIIASLDDEKIAVFNKNLVYKYYIYSHSSSVTGIRLIDNKYILSVSQDGEIKITDLFTKKIIKSMKTEKNNILCPLHYNPEIIIIPGNDGSISFFDINNMKIIKEFRKPVEISSIITLENNEALMISKTTGLIVKFNPINGKTINKLDLPKDTISYIDISNGFLLIGYKSGNFILYDIKNNKKTIALKPLSTEVTSIALYKKYIAFAGNFKDNKIRIYDINKLTTVKTLSQHLDEVTDMKFSSDGKYFITSSKDKRINVYSTTSWLPVYKIKNEIDYVNKFYFDQTGKKLICIYKNDVKVLSFPDLSIINEKKYDTVINEYGKNGDLYFSKDDLLIKLNIFDDLYNFQLQNSLFINSEKLFNFDEKYLAVIKNRNELYLINKVDNSLLGMYVFWNDGNLFSYLDKENYNINKEISGRILNDEMIRMPDLETFIVERETN